MTKVQQAYYNEVANRHFNEAIQELRECKDITCKKIKNLPSMGV